jgi:hypothetical protein
MLSSTLDFLKDNQVILGWIGSGIVVAATGIWSVVKFFAKKNDRKQPKSIVTADRGSIAAGRDISVSARRIADHSKSLH